MAVVDERRERCDGCGNTVPLESLTTVTMPDGERLACCGNCEPHAREAATKLGSLERSQDTCDGCRSEFPANDLEDVVLTDGTVVTCCPTCLEEVPRQDRSSGVANPDGAGAGSTAGDTESESTELATPRQLCSQCHEWVREELYHVTTIDDRTEEMCSDCKAVAEHKGVVKRVRMRRGEAREILRVPETASTQEIREAFLTQIKHAHPDRKSGSESAFKLVKEAYDRLR